MTAAVMIEKMKETFTRHRISKELRRDSGPLFTAAEFRLFAQEYGFNLAHSSLGFTQSNGQAEACVKSSIATDGSQTAHYSPTCTSILGAKAAGLHWPSLETVAEKATGQKKH
ncbi:hypothetical protein J437_LFUL014636 [Ladona fulva]|uniref:Integrase catalytic domain-containing protein n=1 Tax=Ladona fulva TaxID=123851 RepID=A0A8K0KHS8_LADFU|nr:hypothetical protein J437_LFUL014636 [Ladona fulva]